MISVRRVLKRYKAAALAVERGEIIGIVVVAPGRHAALTMTVLARVVISVRHRGRVWPAMTRVCLALLH